MQDQEKLIQSKCLVQTLQQSVLHVSYIFKKSTPFVQKRKDTIL